MRTLGFFGALSLSALTAPLGCGQPFSVGSGTITSSSSAGGAGGAGGDMATSTGGGGGGSGCTDLGCRPGEFCASDGQCKPCSDYSEPLAFAAPVAINVSPGDGPWFPRVRDTHSGQQMVFAAIREGDNQDIAMSTSSSGQWGAGGWLAAYINTATPETGPLRLPIGVGLAEVPSVGNQDVLLLTGIDGSGNRKVFAAGAGTKPPLSSVNEALESYSIAMAHGLEPPRYWYMNRRVIGGVSTTDLRTKLSSELSSVAITDLTLPGGCPVKTTDTPDLAPWVTAAGDILFFHAGYTTASSCAGPFLSKLFYVRITVDTGLPAGAVEEPQIEGLPSTASMLTPSLSPDSCTIYFSSNHEQSLRRLYSARRK